MAFVVNTNPPKDAAHYERLRAIVGDWSEYHKTAKCSGIEMLVQMQRLATDRLINIEEMLYNKLNPRPGPLTYWAPRNDDQEEPGGSIPHED